MADLFLRLPTDARQIEALARPGTGHAAPAAAPQPHSIVFELITDIAGFEALEADWAALMVRSGRPEQVFQTFAWCWHWSRHYLAAPGRRRGARLAIVTGRSDGQLVLLMPFVVTRTAGLTCLSWMGEPVSQYGDVIADATAADRTSLEAGLRFAAEATGTDLVNLRKVRADAVIAPLLTRLVTTVTGTEEAPFMALGAAPDYAAFEARLPAKARKNRRRYLRRLEEHGSVTIEEHSGTETASRLAAHTIRMKRASLKARGQISPTLADPRFAAFFADVAHGRGRPAGCRILALRSAGEVTALQISIDHAAARFLHVAVYSPKFEKCGVGGLLLERATADCYARGIKTFDLLAPRHDYKLEFAEVAVTVNDHALGLTLAGQAYVRCLLGMRGRLKRRLETLPAPIRRAVDGLAARLKRRG